MSLHREILDSLPFDPTERDGLWGYRRAEEPNTIRLGLALGVAVTLCLVTGLGVVTPVDWGLAVFFGLAAAVLARGVLLAQHHLRHGGWQAWRRRETNDRALDLMSGGLGIALAMILATGAWGIGPAFGLGEALFIGVLTTILSRALLLLARWP